MKPKVGDQIIDFMINPGAEMSVVTKAVVPLKKGHCYRRSDQGMVD